MIETERLILRKPRLDDAKALLEYIGDPEVMRWIGGETGDLQVATETIEKWLRRWEDNGVGPFVVERDGRVLGRVGYLIWDRATWAIATYAEAAEPETELGWTLAQEHWGHGYATEAARAARDWKRVDRLISLINPQNVRSMRVAEKLGAQPTETVTLSDGSPAVVWVHPT